MKINEFNIRDLGNSINKFLNPPPESSEERVQKSFTQSFINKVTGSLDAAIRSGLVSPTAANAATPSNAAAPANPNAAANPGAAAPTKTTPGGGAKPGKPLGKVADINHLPLEPKPGDAYLIGQYNYTWNGSSWQPYEYNKASNLWQPSKSAPTKTTPSGGAKPGQPQANTGANVFANMAKQMGGGQSGAASAATLGPAGSPGPAKTPGAAAPAAAPAKVSAPNAGAKAVARNVARNNVRAAQVGTPNGRRSNESKFNHLNYIFENIMSTLDEQATEESISDFINNATLNYIGGMPGLEKYKPNLRKIADQVQATYSKDKGKAALESLGHMVYALIQSSRDADGQFAGAQSQTSTRAQTSSQPQSSAQPQDSSGYLERRTNNELNAQLAKLTPLEKKQLVKFAQDLANKRS